MNFGFAILDFGLAREAVRKVLRIKAVFGNDLKLKIQKRSRRRKWAGSFVILLAIAFDGAVASAQQPVNLPRIGFLATTGTPKAPGHQVTAFQQGLRDLGYNEGKNILVEYRFIEGDTRRNPTLVRELVQLTADALVLLGSPAIRAAKEVTKTIPIIMVTTQNPVAAGFVDSLARPGGNITGVTTLLRELSGKRLEVFKEAVPGLTTVAALMSATQGISDFEWYEESARALKIDLRLVRVGDQNTDFEAAFQAAVKGRASALITVSSGLLNRHAKQIADLAITTRLPSMHERGLYVEAGGLMSYTADEAESFRRAAWYVDKILKGAKPAELPVEQPTKFEFVINLITAKQIGLTIPPNVLARADRVIK